MGRDCWSSGFTFEQCCIDRLPNCWDEVFTYESCCTAASSFSRILGDPTCFRGISGEGGGGFYNYERCCLANDTECWDVDGLYSFERCCSKTIEVAESAVAMPQSCSKELAGPQLGLWRPRHSGFPETLLQEWDFGRLSRVTGLAMFTLPGQSESEVGQFEGHFQLLADSGQGFQPYWGNALHLESAGGRHVFSKLALKEPVAAYRVRLELVRWKGPETLLYASPLGCEQLVEQAAVSLVYCQPLDRAGSAGVRAAVQLLGDMYGWTLALGTAEDAPGCFLGLDRRLRELVAQQRLGREAVVVLSPYLHKWDLQQHALMLKRAADLFHFSAPGALAVLGFPSAGPNGEWVWPLRRIRRQYWKLLYSEYPTGSARRLVQGTDSLMCHGGDAVSGTRIYSPGALSSLIRNVDAIADASWLVNLDLEAQRQGLHTRTFLCTHAIMPEEHYLQHARLTDALAARYDVEAAVLHPSTGLQVNCQVTLRHTGPEGPHVYDVVNDRGLATPWCFRRALRNAWIALAGWWSDLSPRNYVVASDGTGLALFRNGGEPIPWDVDVDVQLYAEGPPAFSFEEFTSWSDTAAPKTALEQHQPPQLARLRELGFSWKAVRDYSARGAGWHIEFQFADATARPTPVSVDLDAVLKAYETSSWFPMSASLAGVRAKYGQDLQLSLTKKYGPAEKRMHKGGDFITCRDPGHSACLPDCVLQEGWLERLCSEACRGVDGGVASTAAAGSATASCTACRTAPVVECEFPDRFIELDYFY